jgi:hypothetical protein
VQDQRHCAHRPASEPTRGQAVVRRGSPG